MWVPTRGSVGLKTFVLSQQSRKCEVVRSLQCVAAAILIVLAASCGQEPGEGKTNPVEAVFKDPLSSKQIKRALLKIEDMPSGYTEDPDLINDEESEEDEISAGSKKCEQLMSALGSKDRAEKPFGEGEVGFKESDFGPFVGESVISFKGSRIKEGMGKIRDAFASCKNFETEDKDGAKTKFRVAPMSFPKLGDDTIAVKMSGEEPSFGMTFDFNLVAVRVDQNVVMMLNFGIGRALGGQKFEKLTRLAVERIDAAA